MLITEGLPAAQNRITSYNVCYTKLLRGAPTVVRTSRGPVEWVQGVPHLNKSELPYLYEKEKITTKRVGVGLEGLPLLPDGFVATIDRERMWLRESYNFV